MKKTSLAIILFISSFTTVFSLGQVSAYGGFQSVTFEDANQNKSTFDGMPYGLSILYDLLSSAVHKFYVGVYFDYFSIKQIDPSTTIDTKSSGTRIGLESKLTLRFIPVVNLYAMIGIGYEKINDHLNANGLTSQLMVGLGYPINDLFQVFLEGGVLIGDLTATTDLSYFGPKFNVGLSFNF